MVFKNIYNVQSVMVAVAASASATCDDGGIVSGDVLPEAITGPCAVAFNMNVLCLIATHAERRLIA